MRFDRYWRIRKWLPDRWGQPCRVVARGRLNSALIEFADGYRVITSRNFVRLLEHNQRAILPH